MPNTSHGSSSLSSVDNALRLLALLSDRQVLRVAEAADLLGVARSTAHRLLSSLRTHGFAVQDKANGAYRPGPVLIELGLAATGRIDIRQLAQPALEELRDRTRETVSVSILEGRDVRFVDCIEGTRSVRVGLRTGKVMRAHCTAAGKALLAALPLAELHRRYPDGELEGQTEASVTSWAALEAELAEIRAGGLAYNREEGSWGSAPWPPRCATSPVRPSPRWPWWSRRAGWAPPRAWVPPRSTRSAPSRSRCTPSADRAAAAAAAAPGRGPVGRTGPAVGLRAPWLRTRSNRASQRRTRRCRPPFRRGAGSGLNERAATAHRRHAAHQTSPVR